MNPERKVIVGMLLLIILGGILTALYLMMVGPINGSVDLNSILQAEIYV